MCQSRVEASKHGSDRRSGISERFPFSLLEWIKCWNSTSKELETKNSTVTHEHHLVKWQSDRTVVHASLVHKHEIRKQNILILQVHFRNNVTYQYPFLKCIYKFDAKDTFFYGDDRVRSLIL